MIPERPQPDPGKAQRGRGGHTEAVTPEPAMAVNRNGGPGMRTRRPAPAPQTVAERMANLRRAHTAHWAHRRAMTALARDVGAVAAMGMEEVRHYLTRRELEVAMLWLGQYTLEDIAIAANYRDRSSIRAVLKRPAVARFIGLVEAAQLERVIAGEFGVRAQARAAAPRVMRRVITKAGGELGLDGLPTGEAARDSDQLRAADLVMQVAGEKEQRSEVVHKHLHVIMEGMTQEELRRLGDQNEWPDRLKPMVAKLGLPQPDAKAR